MSQKQARLRWLRPAAQQPPSQARAARPMLRPRLSQCRQGPPSIFWRLRRRRFPRAEEARCRPKRNRLPEAMRYWAPLWQRPAALDRLAPPQALRMLLLPLGYRNRSRDVLRRGMRQPNSSSLRSTPKAGPQAAITRLLLFGTERPQPKATRWRNTGSAHSTRKDLVLVRTSSAPKSSTSAQPKAATSVPCTISGSLPPKAMAASRITRVRPCGSRRLPNTAYATANTISRSCWRAESAARLTASERAAADGAAAAFVPREPEASANEPPPPQASAKAPSGEPSGSRKVSGL